MQDILNDIFRARGIEKPDRRPLYGYRCSDSEFRQLTHAVRLRLGGVYRNGLPSPSNTMGFCLWAAEWWRRNHDGGHWAWESMLQDGALADHAPSGSYYGRLQDIVDDGLENWGVELLRFRSGRAFLITLACQGGLPLKLIQHESATLRSYFRALLEEIRIFGAAGVPTRELAERVSFRLPRRLRNEVVFELSGELAAAIWRLQNDVAGKPDAIAALDATKPGWRDELPVAVDDGVAKALLNNLLNDAAEVATGRGSRVRFARWLQRSSSGYQLIGRLTIPPTLKHSDLAALQLGLAEIPPRFEVCMVEMESLHPVAHVTRKNGSASSVDAQYVVETLATFTDLIQGTKVIERRSLAIRTSSGLWETDCFSGSSALSGLPWTFEEISDDSEYRFLGEGSVTTRAASALIVVSGTDEVIPFEDGKIEELGQLSGTGRRVLRLSGGATVRDADSNCSRIRTGSASAQEYEYRVVGSHFEPGSSQAPLFLGLPIVRETDSSGLGNNVPSHKLEWRSALPHSRWQPLTDRCIGDGVIRVVDGGLTRFVKTVSLLPKRTAARFLPDDDGRSGAIEIDGFSDADVTLGNALGLDASISRPSANTTRIDLRAAATAPSNVTITALWGSRGRVVLTLPFPANVARFESGGFTLPVYTTVAAGRLSRVRAHALSPKRGTCMLLLGDYRGRDGTRHGRMPLRMEIPEVAPGLFEISLGRLQSAVEARLAFSTDEHAHVRLQIASNDVVLNTAQFCVHRYDFELTADWETGELTLPADIAEKLDPEELESLRVEAVSVLTPLASPVQLRRNSTLSWQYEESRLPGGPLVIVAMQGDWCRSKPFWRYVHPGQNGGEVHPLVYFYENYGTSEADRVHVAKSLLARATGNVSDPAWEVLFDQLEATSKVPAYGFDYLRAMAADHQVATFAAFAASDPDFKRLWRGLEQLPFWWRTVSRESWLNAAAAYVVSLRNEVQGKPEFEKYILTGFDSAVTRIGEMIPPLRAVFARCRARLFGLTPDAQSGMLRNDVVRQSLLRQISQLMSQAPDLLPAHIWAAGFPAVGALAESLESPWLKQLLFKKPGERDSTFEVRNSAVIAALAAFLNASISKAAAYELRALSDLAPAWFDELYDLAYMCAFGLDWSSSITSRLTE